MRRWPTWILFGLIVVLQYPLWFGKGGWLRVWIWTSSLKPSRK